MRRSLSFTTLLSLFWLVLFHPTPGRADTPRLSTLPTGLRILIQPEPDANQIAIAVFVRAGTGEEDGLSGIGSLVSRAAFGSNYQQSGDAVRRTIYTTGGSLEAHWTPDYTIFTCVTTRELFRDAIYLLAQALKSAEFDTDSVAKARTELAVEATREASEPFRVGYAALRQRLYSTSPYRLPFTAPEDSLRRLTPQAAQKFYLKRYRPEKTVLSIVGDVEEEAARKTVENLFFDYERPAPTGARTVTEPASDRLTEQAHVVRRVPTNTTLVLLGSRAPSLKDPDYPAFVVLNALLGGGKSSRLFRQVRDVAGVGYNVGTYLPVLAQEGHLVAYVEYDPTSRAGMEGKPLVLESVEKLIQETVQSLVSNPPAAPEVDRAKRYSIGQFALEHQRLRERAEHLGMYEALGVGFAFDADFPKRLGAVTPGDLLRVATKYLSPTVISVVQPDK